MRGLLIKDIYLAIRHCGILFVVALVFLAISMTGENNSFFAVFPSVFAGIVPLTVMGYDEQSRWNEYADGLPYSRAQTVSVKYILGLIGCILFSLLAVLALAARGALTGGTADALEIFAYGAVCLAVGVLFPTLTLPFFFRFGVNKGRVAYYVVIGLVAAGAAAVSGTVYYAPEGATPPPYPHMPPVSCSALPPRSLRCPGCSPCISTAKENYDFVSQRKGPRRRLQTAARAFSFFSLFFTHPCPCF